MTDHLTVLHGAPCVCLLASLTGGEFHHRRCPRHDPAREPELERLLEEIRENLGEDR